VRCDGRENDDFLENFDEFQNCLGGDLEWCGDVLGVI
jgi:hypothetical protein